MTTRPTSIPAESMPIADYHQRTKHRPGAFARGPAALDWDDQPGAFRDYPGAQPSPLPLPPTGFPSDRPSPGAVTYAEVADGPSDAGGRAVTPDSISYLLVHSLGISAWKRYGDARWALRCNPSSGNLHPTEAYLLSTGVDGIAPGLQLYRPEDHSLALRCAYTPAFAAQIAPLLPPEGFLLGLSTIAWREAWKYGERAWRYCLLDLGHALATLRYAAAILGWRVDVVRGCSDADLGALLGLDRTAEFPADEPERPELLLAIGPPSTERPPVNETLIAALVAASKNTLASQHWQGRASRLSPHHHYDWVVVDQAATAARRPRGLSLPQPATSLPTVIPHPAGAAAEQLLRSRRSAQAMDGATGITRTDFFRLLDHLLPRAGLPPWGEQPGRARIHLLLFVHRVDSLPSGLYLLSRDPGATAALHAALHDELQALPVDGCPAQLELRLLVAAEVRQTATQLACRQAIGGDGAFCVAMLGEFDAALADGPWGYRELLTEAGLIGQALYLEAEAIGLQGTGIGCFFDDALHELLGLVDTQYQVVYQFTVGKAVVDTRIADEPAYARRDETV